ncbi:hypothetical protein FACS189468_1320 [Spirochaetia bacterium]|nr:hypothetical protein FACS189468_1320 [Spirochaetia bacterium]
MKRRGLLLLFPLILGAACNTPPPQELSEQPPDPKIVGPVAEERFDPKSITKEEFNSTKSDVQRFIRYLNGVLRAKNYKVWISHLSASYVEEKGSKEFLEKTSAILMQSKLVSQRKNLHSLYDYFLYVVVPSHQNDRVDDIEFVSHTRVRAYALSSAGQRLILWDLEQMDHNWEIIN